MQLFVQVRSAPFTPSNFIARSPRSPQSQAATAVTHCINKFLDSDYPPRTQPYYSIYTPDFWLFFYGFSTVPDFDQLTSGRFNQDQKKAALQSSRAAAESQGAHEAMPSDDTGSD